MTDPSRPSLALARQLAGWTHSARNRLFRLADIQRRDSILEVGAGWGCVAEELSRRVGSRIIAVDQDAQPLQHLRQRTGGRVETIVADVHQLPLARRSVDLVVSHFALLWCRDPASVIAEAVRVMTHEGVVCLVEPDYGGLMEYPDVGLRDTWITSLQARQAQPLIGRMLPSLLQAEGLQTRVLFCDRYLPPSSAALDFLQTIADPSWNVRLPQTLFLPLWMVLAQRPQ